MSDFKKPYPACNDIWQHANGNEYRVLFVTNEGNRSVDHPEQVVYEGTRNGAVWSRPLATWHERMTFVRNTHPGLREAGIAGAIITSNRDFPLAPTQQDALRELQHAEPVPVTERWLSGARWAHKRWLVSLGVKR